MRQGDKKNNYSRNIWIIKGIKKELFTWKAPSMNNIRRFPPPCSLDWKDSVSPKREFFFPAFISGNDLQWYRITSETWSCPLLAKNKPVLCRTRTETWVFWECRQRKKYCFFFNWKKCKICQVNNLTNIVWTAVIFR